MKRVLVVCFDFPPQGGTGTIRVAKFVKYLPQFGWEPVVVCSDTNWNYDESLLDDIPAGVEVRRVPWPKLVRHFAPWPAGVSGRPSRTNRSTANKASWVRRAVTGVSRQLLVPDVNLLWTGAAQRTCIELLQAHPCDVILTTSPPNSVHLVGEWVHRRFGLPWVADFRDVWTAENLALQQAGRVHFARQRRVEARMLAACSRAVMISEPLRERTLEVFGTHLRSKLVVIPNGFDPADFVGPPSRSQSPTRFTIAFFGTVLGPQEDNDFPEGLRLALEESEDFRRYARVRFIGRLGPTYQSRLRDLTDNVEVRGFVTHQAAINAMRETTVLLVLLPPTRLASMTYTNKFFEYLAARRPILALTPPGVISAIVKGRGIGLVAAPDKPTDIASALLTMFNQIREHPDAYQGPPDLYQQFDRRQLTSRLAEVLNGVGSARPVRQERGF